jgi:hypothetical protein
LIFIFLGIDDAVLFSVSCSRTGSNSSPPAASCLK